MNNLKYFLLNGYQEYNHLMMGGAAEQTSYRVFLLENAEEIDPEVGKLKKLKRIEAHDGSYSFTVNQLKASGDTISIGSVAINKECFASEINNNLDLPIAVFGTRSIEQMMKNITDLPVDKQKTLREIHNSMIPRKFWIDGSTAKFIFSTYFYEMKDGMLQKKRKDIHNIYFIRIFKIIKTFKSIDDLKAELKHIGNISPQAR